MPKIDEATLGAYLNKLMQNKLGPYLDWKPAPLENHAGPFAPAVFDKFNEKRQKIVAACTDMLERRTDGEIQILVDNRMDDPNEIAKEWHSFLRTEIAQLKKSEPPWYAGGFGHHDHAADFEYWAQVRHFTCHEAVLLSLGVEPDSIAESELTKMTESLANGADLWSTLKYLIRRRGQFDRQFPVYQYHDTISPKALFDWIELVELEIHSAFTSRYIIGQPSDAKQSNTKQPHKREIDSVCQLFAAMVIEYYGYEPDASRSPIPKEIGELAAGLGLQISDDTIRKYLKRGANFISDEWKPK